MNATISADIISSTSLSTQELEVVQNAIHSAFTDIETYIQHQDQSTFWGRIVKGDSIECYLENPKYALRSALLLKCIVLRISQSFDREPIDRFRTNGYKYFRRYGVRLAIGLGDMKTVDKQRDIMDGEAIYASGRKIAEYSTSGKDRIIIKKTLFFASSNDQLNQILNASLGLVNALFRNATDKQIDVIYYKLLNTKDRDIEKILNIKHSAINQRSVAFGWNAVADFLDLYENKLNLAQ